MKIPRVQSPNVIRMAARGTPKTPSRLLQLASRLETIDPAAASVIAKVIELSIESKIKGRRARSGGDWDD